MDSSLIFGVKPGVRRADIRIGDIVFSPDKRILLKQAGPAKLRHKEAEALWLLCKRYPDHVSRQEFETAIWSEGYVISHTITQTIRSLRAALGDAGRTIVVTLPKQGYALNLMPQFCDDEAPSEPPCRVSAEVQNAAPATDFVEDEASSGVLSTVSETATQVVPPVLESVRHVLNESAISDLRNPIRQTQLWQRACLIGASLGAAFTMMWLIGKWLNRARIEPVDVLHPIVRIGLDNNKDSKIINEIRSPAFYLLKKVGKRYLACRLYKGGEKCDFV